MSEEPKSNTALAQIETSSRGLVLTNLDDMQMAAQLILQSGLCPDGYKTKAQVFVGLQTGAEIGLKPMQALNSIAVIRGKPTLWGDAALGLVKRSGLLKEFSEEVTGFGDEMIATVISVRIDGTKVTTTFDVADAKTAQLWGKMGPWKTHPKRMLKYKARAFNLRDNFPDVLMGMHLTEEMEGEVLEPLPAPECDVAPRDDRRKKVESLEVETSVEDIGDFRLKVDSQEVTNITLPEQPAEPVKDEVTEDTGSAGTAGDDLNASYEEVVKIYADLGGTNFTEFAAEVLCRGEDEVEKSEQFDVEMLNQLRTHLANKGI